MKAKKAARTAAVLEIEPTFAKLKISQLKKGQVSDLENLECPLRLGHGIGIDGKISPDGFRELSQAMRGFKDAWKEYGLETCRTLIGYEVQAAKNAIVLMDRLNADLGFEPERFDFGPEHALICYESLKKSGLNSGADNRPVVLAAIGTFDLCVSVFEHERAVFCRALPAGPLRLAKWFAGFPETDRLADAAEEWLYDVFRRFGFHLPAGIGPRLILTGHSLSQAVRSGAPRNRHTAPVFTRTAALFQQIRSLSAEQIAMRLKISEEEAKILYFTLMSANSLITAVHPDGGAIREIELSDALMPLLLLPKAKADFLLHVRDGAVSCAHRAARKCGRSSAHAEFVRETACAILDKMCKEYGFGAEGRILLELAAILYDCKNGAADTDFYGISENGKAIAAAAADNRLFSSYGGPKTASELASVRFAAILSLAEALDQSGKRKLSGIRIKAEKKRLKFTAESREQAALEKWAFGKSASRFMEAFGITPELLVHFPDDPN